MDLKEIVWHSFDWIKFGTGQGQVASCCEHGDESSEFHKLREVS
jgi:hypothetical protein